jgi:hypothetical protein
MRPDSQFRPERFTDPHLIQERTLSDCKRKIYKLRWSPKELEDWQRDTSGEISSPKEDLAEFIRDIIAIANAARQRGMPGYLLFGVDDTTKRILGVEGQTTKPNVSLNTHSQDKINELNERDFNSFLNTYIWPTPPVIDYRRGYVEEKLVSYLQIIPEATPEPYQVKTFLGDIKVPLYAGDCWLRKGDSKGKRLKEEEKRYLYPWTVVPYISIDQWKTYLIIIQERGEYPRVEDTVGYQDLYSNRNTLLTDEITNFLESSYSLLVIKGPAGCGKSVFLQNLACQMAANLLQELEDDSEEVSFQEFIPIFFSLNSFSIKMGESLGREILSRVIGRRLLDVSSTDEPEKLFRDEGKRWLILLDALDEAIPETQSRDNVWSAICQLAETYPNIKVVLTVRLAEFRYQLPESAKPIIVSTLSKHQVINFLQTYIAPDEFAEISEFLDSDEELWEHLRLPLFLQTAVNYLSGGEISEVDLEDIYQTSILDSSDAEPVSEYEDDDVLESSAISLDQIKATIREQLVDEAELPLENEVQIADAPLEEPTRIRMGVFLDRVFHRLWRHNQKKFFPGGWPAVLDDTYESLGAMAANMADDRPILRVSEAKFYVKEALTWILDLGILIRNRFRNITGISFPTRLSRTYFAAFFLTVLLESRSDELSNVIRGSPTFWERCLSLVLDLTSEDVSQIMERIETVKGEGTDVQI